MTPRKIVLDLLVKCERSKQYSNISLDNALQTHDLKDADRALCCALFMGVIEKKITLDYYISALSTREIEKIDVSTLSIIRMGLYQLIFMDKIPPHAAVNESVALGTRANAGFINAILRGYQRRADTLSLPSAEDSPALYLSVCYSVCLPLAKKLIAEFGTERAKSFLASCASVPKTTLRTNTLKISRDDLASKIGGAEISERTPHALRVSGSVRELPGFSEGAFFVQDEASQICVGALDAHAGDTVIDACSAPGSKSFGTAIDMKNQGRILSFDLHKSKISLIESGAARLGIDIISAGVGDGRIFIPELLGSADRVLCDVPCSGFGVLAKKPELRYKDPTVSAGLPAIQLEILRRSLGFLARGGRLVYSTCTVLPEENEAVVEEILRENQEISLLSAQTYYPHVHGTDGFFVAVLTRR